MTAALLRAGLHSIYLVAPLVRLACTERNGCACSENGLWLPSKVARPRLSSAKKPGAGLTLRVTSDRARFTTTTDPSSSGPDRLDLTFSNHHT